MCARLLACPLCSQPGFLTLDALRAGLVSVATRPLICPVCSEVLLGIDKLTIHLFSHTINLNNNTTESSKPVDVAASSQHPIAIYNSTHNVALQDWNMLETQQLDKIEISHDNDETCIQLSNSNISTTENKIPVINSEFQAQNQDFIKSSNQNTFASDYDHDRMKINILPQLNENNMILKPITNVQHVSRTNSITQYSSNNNNNNNNNKHNKQLSTSLENIQTEEANISDFADNCTDKQNSKSLAARVFVEAINTNIHRNIETECKESNSVQCIAKEKLATNITNEESDLSNFQFIQNTISTCGETLPEDCNDEIMLKIGTENQDQHSQEYKKILTHTQIHNKILQTITSKEKTERCDICGFHFPSVNILTLHQQLVHEQDSNNISEKVLKNYSCYLCSKIFKMRGSLMVHMRVAHIGHSSGFLLKKDQIELAHSDIGYNCPTCGKKFKKEQHVTQHLKIHEGKQWECDTCSKMFTTKYFLKKHKRLHSGEMPYKCKICDKNFTFQQSYHKHRLYHKDDKPHTCRTCGRSFKELSTLHNHERIHTGEKPFACETCGKCFRQRVSYLVHRRIHTGVMPYKCTMCDKSFRYKVSQRTHKCLAQTSGSEQKSCELSSSLIQKTNDETIGLQPNNSLQKDQSMINIMNNEENKFVLIINAQGQHILISQSELNNMSSEKKEHVKFEDDNNVNKHSKDKIYSMNNFNSEELKESTKLIEKAQLNNEKKKNINDSFSIMSCLENSVLSLPEMEHLRVSSPKQKEDLLNSYTDFPQISDNVQLDTMESDIEQSFNHDKDISDSLQAINLESLKELLYNMNEK